MIYSYLFDCQVSSIPKEQLVEEPQETSGRLCHVNIWKKDGSIWSWVLPHGMALLLHSGRRVNKGALQNFGQSWGTEFTEVCDVSWERKHIRMPACSLLCMFFVYLVLVSLGPIVSQWRSDFQESQWLNSHLGTFQGLNFFLMDKFQLWSWKWSAFCVQFS